MPRTIEGVVREGRIEWIDGPELAEGQHVRVVIELDAGPMSSGSKSSFPDEGVVQTEATPEFQDFLNRLRQNRMRQWRRPHPTGSDRESAAGILADDPDFDAVMEQIEREGRLDHGREVAS